MSQNYVYVQRPLTGGQTQVNGDGSIIVQNVGEFISYLNEVYLSQGFEIQSITPIPASADTPVGTIQYGYHLVKNTPDAKVSK